VTHDQRDIVHLGDRACLIEKGKIARMEEIEAFLKEEGDLEGYLSKISG
jgi:ABC-type proline/glycine betaine transport system ATPase subunit